MAYIKLEEVYKVYDESVLAVDDFNLDIKQNEFVALVGPSGCGKSTLLRMIAGLEEITHGTIEINGRVINDIHAKDRDVSMVFQNYALYPHLNIFDNIAFGLKLRKNDKKDIQEKVQAVAEVLDLTDYLERKPSQLSGGQRQRVALGRAIVQESSIFLMDEPLSNLDAKLRSQMRVEILKLHKELGVTTVYVTHDQIEAMSMADKIVVMNEGIIQQIGTPRELYHKPNNLFVAKFIGDPEINLFKAKVEEGQLLIDGKAIRIDKRIADMLENYPHEFVTLGIRPENISVNIQNDDDLLEGSVDLIEMRGDTDIIFTSFNNSKVVIKSYDNHEYNLDEKITFSFDKDKILLFDIENGNIL